MFRNPGKEMNTAMSVLLERELIVAVEQNVPYLWKFQQGNGGTMNPFQAASKNKKMLTLIGVYAATLGNILVSTGFATMLPVAALEMGVRVKKEEAAPFAAAGGKFDIAGMLSVVVLLGGLILFLSFGTNYVPFGTPFSWCLLVLAVVGLLALFLVIRKKGNEAFIPAPVLKDRNTLILAICNFLFNSSSLALVFFMPAYVIYVMNGSPTEASLTTSLIAVVGLILGPFLGRRIAKVGSARGILTLGTIVRIAITLVLLFILSPSVPLWMLYICMFIAGFYNSQHSVTFSTAPQIQIAPELRVRSNSIIQLAQNLAAGVAISVYTVVIGLFGIAEGMKISLIIAIALAVVGLCVGQLLKKVPVQEKAPGEQAVAVENKD